VRARRNSLEEEQHGCCYNPGSLEAHGRRTGQHSHATALTDGGEEQELPLSSAQYRDISVRLGEADFRFSSTYTSEPIDQPDGN